MYQQLKRASMALTLSSVCFLAFAQKTIQGTVKDANGDPMIGVTITDQNGKAGGITDLDGKFTIQNADPNTVLTFSYIGCKPKKVKVGSQKHGTSYLKMTMQLLTRSLSLVMVLCVNAT